MYIKPITPADVLAQRVKDIPDDVVAAFNTLIQKNLHGSAALVEQDDVIDVILVRMNAERTSENFLTREDVFLNHWLDVEPLYEDAGWHVKYEKPGLGDSFKACFTFTMPRRK